LEIGTGGGFVTACLAHLAKKVYSIDQHDAFIEQATLKMQQQSINNVTLETKDAFSELDLSKGYDVIAVTGSVSEAEAIDYFQQMLNLKGRLFIIVGSPSEPIMQALLIKRENNGTFSRTSVFETEGLPLTSSNQKEVTAKKAFSF
jgi:protein-L-isoaspartate(D-aspartate) O-methyltransferase